MNAMNWLCCRSYRYRVPPRAGSELLKFDGSVIVEPTCGELAMKKFLFSVPTTDQGDPDRPVKAQ
jgi:hypothetical protein